MSNKSNQGARITTRSAMLTVARSLTETRSLTGDSHGAVSTIHTQFRPEQIDFSTLPHYREMKKVRAIADVVGFNNPYFKLHEGRSGATCVIGGRRYVNFTSYDYLGLNGEPSVNAAAEAAIKTYGTSVSASRPTAGDRPLHRSLESKLAKIYQTEDALSFVSGHATNVSVIGELLGQGDLILFDALCHNSIVLGTKLSAAARQSFPHNDVTALERLLQINRRNYNRVLIVVEGLYSMDGDLAPLPELVELKSRYGAWLMVDEAHGLGVLGRSGKGLFEHFDVKPSAVDIWMGTLSKTLSGCGGYIAAPRALIEILKFNASAFMFSVGMSPPVAAAALAALELMEREHDRIAKLHDNSRKFLAACREARLDTANSAGYGIVIVMVGDSIRAAKLAEQLFSRGVNAIPVTYPAVPMRSARLRFFLTAKHTHEQIEDTVAVLQEEMSIIQKTKFGIATAAADYVSN